MAHAFSNRLQVIHPLSWALILSLLLLAAAPRAQAESVQSLRLELREDAASYRQLRRDLAESRAHHADVRQERDLLVSRVQRRLASIYKAGGTKPMSHIGIAEGNVERAGDVADAVRTVGRHDARLLERGKLLGQELADLQRRISSLEDAAARKRVEIARDRRRLTKAIEAARAARERALRMARIADSPLAPSRMAPETIELESASSTSGVEPSGPAGYSESGEASIYASSFTGRPTASGEPYNPGAMTAAHKTLPLGTWVAVDGPGGTALVRINDRGPFVGGRIIDLSPAAAAAVGVNGLGNVTITVQG